MFHALAMINLDEYESFDAPPARARTLDEYIGFSRPPVENSADLQRILALPRRPRPDGVDLVERASAYLRKPNAACRCAELRPAVVANGGDPCITRLRPIQAAALAEISRCGGYVGMIGTGFGKTLIEILAPHMLARHGVRTTLLLVPANLVDQIERDVELYGQHFKMPDVIIVGAKLQNHRNPGAPLLHVMSYNRLSNASATVFLQNLDPDAIIADECQNLRHVADGGVQGSVRANRVKDFITYKVAQGRRCSFLPQSGSPTNASLDDYGHLAAWALANPAAPADFASNGSPLPVDPHVRKDWNTVIGPGGDEDAAGALRRLCAPGEAVRSGFRRRLHETRGVIATTESVIDADLRIQARKVKVPRDVRQMIETVRDTWTRPDGEELTNPLDMSKCLRELACGLYLRWVFPRGEPYELIMEWLEARKLWHKEMREALRARTPHMDSPLLCARAAARAWGDDLPEREEDDDEDALEDVVQDGPTDIQKPNNLPRWKAAAWPRWRDVRKAVRPETEAVRVNPYLALDAADWGHTHKGVIWYETTGFGTWVAELSGLTWRHPGDPLIDPKTKALRLPEDGSSVILTARSYGTGIDGLQHLYHEMLYTQFGRSAEKAEQTLGRLFREGQRARAVTADVYRHTKELAEACDAAIACARYVQESTGSGQKLLIGWRS